VALFERLLDHAPLFPPASLPLPEALAEDRRARESEASFALGRFVCPASRLAEVPDVGRGVSVVLDADLPAADAGIEAVEAPAPQDLDALAALAPEGFVELPLDASLEDRLDELARAGLHAKVRCGGASVPAVAALARFVRACRERGVAFKATAGFHHAVSAGDEHGLVNLLAAVVFGDEEEALSERDPAAFAADEGAFRWRDRAATPSEVAAARRRGLRSVGSCSFFEPVDELAALGLLPR
jgi:hypothetical protein